MNNKNNKKNIIIKVVENSIAQEVGICPGDELLFINNKKIIDIFDYRYLCKDTYIEIFIKKSDDDEIIYEIEKDEDEDIGLIFDDGIMDKAKSCTNKCIFCFIDQLPKNMRKTLYFKDDDSRLSFLQGNYVTLTNMKQDDIDRIIFYHLSPINISVHTTDLDLRYFMLKNKNSKNILKNIKKFYDNNIWMNFQVVLCKNINDKKNLDKTIYDLSKFIQKSKSLSIVPAGLTNNRQNLFKLENFQKNDFEKLANQVNRWQKYFLKKFGTRFVYLSDEIYLNCDRQMPSYDSYEDFPQLENGVGMIRLFENQFFEYLNIIKLKKLDINNKKFTIVTGFLAYDFMCNLMNILKKVFINFEINVIKIKNDFFGENITVVGLITGIDIIKNLKNYDLGEFVILSKNCLKTDEDIFLDNITLDQLQSDIKTKVYCIPNDAKQLIDVIINN